MAATEAAAQARAPHAGDGGAPATGTAVCDVVEFVRIAVSHVAILVVVPALTMAASSAWYAIDTANMLPVAAFHSMRDADPELEVLQWWSVVRLLNDELRMAFSALLVALLATIVLVVMVII